MQALATLLATLFAYFVVFAVLASYADMSMLQLLATALLGLSVGEGSRFVRDSR